MFPFNKDSKLIDYIIQYPQVLSESSCKYIIDQNKNNQWKKHTWYAYDRALENAYDESLEFFRSEMTFESNLILNAAINKVLDMYIDRCAYLFTRHGHTKPLLNMYTPNTLMQPHVDHITSMFDGMKRGIPILSVLGGLNDDYKGGEFVFWEDHKVKIRAGDIIVFPSLFMYQHRVNKVIENNRYTFVSWVY